MKFKRHLIRLSLLSAALFLLAGCTGQVRPGPSDSPDPVSPSPVSPAPSPELTPAYGAGVSAGELPSASLWRADQVAQSIPADLPVVVDRYPTHHGGPGYEITEELAQSLGQNILDFLQLAGADSSGAVFDDSNLAYGARIVTGIEGLNSISAQGASMGMSLPISGAASNMSLQLVEDNPYYNAALEWLGITDPVVQQYVTPTIDGGILSIEYVVFQAGDTPLEQIYNRSFSCMNILVYPDEGEFDGITLQTHKIPRDTVSDPQITASGQDALALASAQLSAQEAAGLDEALCEVVYESTVCYGYYVPVYHFYIPQETADGGTQYRVVSVSPYQQG